MKRLEDIKYRTYKKAEPYLNRIEELGTEEIIKVVNILYETEVKDKPYEEIVGMLTNFLTIVGSTDPDLIIKFESDKVKYGFLPNFSEITTGELIDLDNLLIDRNFEAIASIIYRPITKESKDGRYEVEEYKGYNEETFKDASLRFYLGFINFFYKSFQILSNNSHTSTKQK